MQFSIGKDFMLDGKPLKLISGSIHYFRIPPSKWYQSLYNLKAMGANAVETYIPWNFHETEAGIFDFDEWHDVERFISIAEELGLLVIVRPSPYICAEWEFGGIPAWVLNFTSNVRSRDRIFLHYVKRYYENLLPRLVPHLATHGGRIIMMQIENEYGSYSDDKVYPRQLVKMMRELGIDVPFFTSDGSLPAALQAGALIEDGILPTVNFGSDSNTHFDNLQAFMSENHFSGPLMCMEFWDGWFNQWGEPVIRRSANDVVEEVKSVLKRGSINFYMFHGGTSYGFMNGANESVEEGYNPQVTSYDYDGILNEQGDPTEKFFKLQDLLCQGREKTKPIISKMGEERNLENPKYQSLWNCLDTFSKHNSYRPLPMDDLKQQYGYMLYETSQKLRSDIKTFQLIKTADRATIFLNHQRAAVRTRDNMETPVKLEADPKEKKLSILIENRARTNFGPYLISENQKKGIRGGVFQGIHYLSEWQQYALDFKNLRSLSFQRKEEGNTTLPRFTQFTFQINASPKDIFIDLTDAGKGVVFVNGLNLGRFWDVGPFLSAFAPADAFVKGENTIIVFQEEGPLLQSLHLTNKPVVKSFE